MELASIMPYASTMSSYTSIAVIDGKPVHVFYVPYQIAGSLPGGLPQPSSSPLYKSYESQNEPSLSAVQSTPSSSPEVDAGLSPTSTTAALNSGSPSSLAAKRKIQNNTEDVAPAKRPRKRASRLQSPTTSTNSDGSDPVPAEGIACKVCVAPATYQHYGALSCLACSAFFRRTVAERRTYACKRRKGCGLEPTAESSCQSCRFQRCLVAGMVASEVLSTKSSRLGDANNGTLQRTMDAQNGLQLEWVRVLIQNFGSYVKFIEFTRAQKLDVLFREHRLLKMEFEVLRQLLQSSDVLGAQHYLRVDADAVALQFLHTWNLAEIVISTSRNMGWATNKMHRLDELFIEASTQGFTSYYAADSRIRDRDAITKATVQKCEKVFDLAKRLRSLRLDDAELAALFQMLLATFEPDLFVSRDALLAYRNSVFRSLAAHHKATLADSVVRCDLIVQFCAELQDAVLKQNDYFVLVESHRA